MTLNKGDEEWPLVYRKVRVTGEELFTQETKTTQCWPEGLKLLPLQLGYTLESLECRREHMGSFESVLRTLNAQPHWTTHSSYRARVIPDGRGGVPEKSAIRGKLDKRIGREGEGNRGCRGLKGKYIWSLGEALNTKLSCALSIWWAVRPSRALSLPPYHTMLLFVKHFRAGSLFDVFHCDMRWASRENINISISQWGNGDSGSLSDSGKSGVFRTLAQW